jgi:hypothetical protein
MVGLGVRSASFGIQRLLAKTDMILSGCSTCSGLHTPMDDRKLKMHWYRMGHYYGYPQCCIDYFCQTMTPGSCQGHNTPEYITMACAKLRAKHKSFMPCPMCAKRINKDIDAYLKCKPNIATDLPQEY